LDVVVQILEQLYNEHTREIKKLDEDDMLQAMKIAWIHVVCNLFNATAIMINAQDETIENVANTIENVSIQVDKIIEQIELFFELYETYSQLHNMTGYTNFSISAVKLFYEKLKEQISKESKPVQYKPVVQPSTQLPSVKPVTKFSGERDGNWYWDGEAVSKTVYDYRKQNHERNTAALSGSAK
jgi:hypothetical protein